MKNKALRLLVGSSTGLITSVFSQQSKSYADKPVQIPKVRSTSMPAPERQFKTIAASKADMKQNLINIVGLHKADVLLVLYNAARVQSEKKQSWYDYFFCAPKSSALKVIDACCDKNDYYIDTVDLGSGAKTLKIDLRPCEIDPTKYDKENGYVGFAAHTIDLLSRKYVDKLRHDPDPDPLGGLSASIRARVLPDKPEISIEEQIYRDILYKNQFNANQTLSSHISESSITDVSTDKHDGMNVILKYEDWEAFIGRIVAIKEHCDLAGPYKDKGIMFALIKSHPVCRDIPKGIIIEYLLNKEDVSVTTYLYPGQTPYKEWVRLATAEELLDLRKRDAVGSSRFFSDEIFRPGITKKMIDQSLTLLSSEAEDQKSSTYRP